MSNNEFIMRVESVLKDKLDPYKIEEGIIFNVNKLISDTIRIPEGDYIIAKVNTNSCILIPTSEAAGQQKFEVFKPTLAGFFNPEVHKKTIERPSDEILAEHNHLAFATED